MMWWANTLRTSAEDLGTLAEYDPLTGYDPNDLHISETTELFIQESSGEDRSLNSHDLEYDDCTIGTAPPSPRSEKMQRAVDKLITLLTKVCRPVSRRLSVIEQGDLLLISLIR